jgi:ketosteroid isomerase-like protein
MKRVLLSISALTILAVFTPTSAPVVASQETDVNSLRAAQQAAIEAFASKNPDRMVSAYSADATLMFPNSPILQGENLRAAIKALAADPNFSIRFTTDKAEVAKSGELGYTRGTYTMTMSDPSTKKPLREKGKYVTIYARQGDGSWKMIEDIDNPDSPATPVASAK